MEAGTQTVGTVHCEQPRTVDLYSRKARKPADLRVRRGACEDRFVLFD